MYLPAAQLQSELPDSPLNQGAMKTISQLSRDLAFVENISEEEAYRLIKSWQVNGAIEPTAKRGSGKTQAYLYDCQTVTRLSVLIKLRPYITSSETLLKIFKGDNKFVDDLINILQSMKK